MINKYIATVHVTGHYMAESPKCPSRWIGSGCYDIEVKTWLDTEVEVWANTEKEAKELVELYGFTQGYTIEVDDMYVKITFIESIDRGEDEVGVIEPVNIDWQEYDYD